MDWKQLMVQIIDILAWPITTVILTLLLRKQLSSLLGTLRSLKYKDLSLEFGQKLEEAKENAIKAGLEDVKDKDIETYFNDLAQVSPRACILESWIQIEAAVEKIIRKHGEGYQRRVFGPPTMKLLELVGLNEGERSLFNALRVIRNLLVHEDKLDLPKEQSLDYAKLALRLANKIDK